MGLGVQAAGHSGGASERQGLHLRAAPLARRAQASPHLECDQPLLIHMSQPPQHRHPILRFLLEAAARHRRERGGAPLGTHAPGAPASLRAARTW